MLDAYCLETLFFFFLVNPFDFAACRNCAAVCSFNCGCHKWTLIRLIFYSNADALKPPSQCTHFHFSLQLLWILRSVLFDLFVLGSSDGGVEAQGWAGMAKWWEGSTSAKMVRFDFSPVSLVGWLALISFRTVPGQLVKELCQDWVSCMVLRFAKYSRRNCFYGSKWWNHSVTTNKYVSRAL